MRTGHLDQPRRAPRAVGPLVRLAGRAALCCACLALPGAARAGGAEERVAAVRLDLPAQPLASALEAFSAASGSQVLYDARLAEGRRSAAVPAGLPAGAVLDALLADTGLRALRSAPGSFVILAAPELAVQEASAAPAQGWQQPRALEQYGPFLGAAQAAVLDALCGDAATRPGPYRLAFQLWVEGAGAIARVKLLGTTGDAGRDARLSRALGAVDLARPPPAGMPQPITLVIARRPPEETGDCAGPGDDASEFSLGEAPPPAAAAPRAWPGGPSRS